MSDGRGDDLEPRVSALEREMAEVRDQAAQARADAAAARVLSAGADRDVSEVRAELRAHTRAISALRQTQVDFDRRLSSMERTTRDGFADMHRRFAEMDTGFAEMRTGFGEMRTGMSAIVNLLQDGGQDR
jgi:chromosome segregation ATPase